MDLENFRSVRAQPTGARDKRNVCDPAVVLGDDAYFPVLSTVAVLVVALPTVLAHSGIAGHALASVLGLNRLVIGLSGTLVSAVFACLVGLVSMYVARDRVRNYPLG